LGSITCGLYYKHMTIINDDSSIISRRSSKLIGGARVITYNRNMFIKEATEGANGSNAAVDIDFL